MSASVTIPRDELAFVASRSGGPGGQNVNKVSTRVTLRFDVAASAALTELEKARVREKLASRIGKDGVLSVTSQRHRSQIQNREAAVERFAELLAEALAVEAPRRKTKPSKAAKAERVETKKHRGGIKKNRRLLDDE